MSEVDLSGKVAIVTEGNTGIGYELVKGLAWQQLTLRVVTQRSKFKLKLKYRMLEPG